MIILLPGAAGAQTAPSKPLALVIANGSYQRFEALSVTARDGERIAGALSTTGFVDASGSGPVAVNRDLSLAQMLEKVRVFREQLKAAGPTALGVFYFSGHGAALSSFGDMVLIPTDAGEQLAADNARLTRAALVRELMGSGAQNVLVILDICRNVIPSPPMRRSAVKSALTASSPARAYAASCVRHKWRCVPIKGFSSPFRPAPTRSRSTTAPSRACWPRRSAARNRMSPMR